IQQKYIIVTCNYVARARGLTKLMTVKEAKSKCPELVLVCGEDLTHYRNMSYKISRYLQSFCPLAERLGFDENFLDITTLVNERMHKSDAVSLDEVSGHIFADQAVVGTCDCGCTQRLVIGSQIAAEIRAGLQSELGITCCAGISHNKLLAKLVASCFKPNQQTVLLPCHAPQLLSKLESVRQIPGIGHATAKKLQELGIVTVDDMLEADFRLIEDAFGNVAIETMKNLCQGVDNSPVVVFGPPQTISDEDSFKKCSSLADARVKISQLLRSILLRLVEDGRIPHTLRLSIRRMSDTNRYSNRESRQCPIPGSVFNRFSAGTILQVASKLETLALGLFTKMLNPAQSFHLTLINVAFTKLEGKSGTDIGSFFESQEKQTAVNLVGPNCVDQDVCFLDMGQSVEENLEPSFKVIDGFESRNVGTCMPDTVELDQRNNLCAEQFKDGKEVLVSVGHKGKQPVKRKSLLSTWLSSPEKTANNAKKRKVPSSDGTDVYSDACSRKYVKLLYEDIDKEMLAGLPKDIQNEITEHALHNRSASNKELNLKGISEQSVYMKQPINLNASIPNGSVIDELRSHELLYIPADVDRSVFAALPPEIQREMSNDWKRRDITVSKNHAEKCAILKTDHEHKNQTQNRYKSRSTEKTSSDISSFFRKHV
ncbi:hypothetical protein DPMN_110621, partial [Dreissena polymorpha]